MEKAKSSFRVKVNLSKIFQDHRKLSWIFVDTTKLLRIEHLKGHIANIFDIPESFYLLLDSVYLPCKEDVRIIHSDNPITLVPGASVNNSSEIRECPDGYSQQTSFLQKSNAQASTFDKKEVQSDEEQEDLYSPNKDVNATVLSGKSYPETTMYHSMLDASEVVSQEESETISFKDSKEVDSMLTEDSSFSNTPAKRKRPRRKKVKRLETQNSNTGSTPRSDVGKPKIIQDVVLGTGKHIRFSNQDEEITSPSACMSNNFNKFQNGSLASKQSPTPNLTALLSLKQCSTPLMFTCKKSEKQTKVEKSAKIDEENPNESNKDIISSNGTEDVEKNCNLQLDNVDVENCPPLVNNPQVDDVIAFKIFKMGNDYTPQVSEYIFGQIINIHAITTLCTIKVLRGQKEIEEPKGKLSLPTDEDETPSGVIKLNYNQLMDARLVFRKC